MEGLIQAKPKYNCWCHGCWSWQAWWLPWCPYKLQLHWANSCWKCWFSCSTCGIVRWQKHINRQKHPFLCCSPNVSYTATTSSTMETIRTSCYWLSLSKYPRWFECTDNLRYFCINWRIKVFLHKKAWRNGSNGAWLSEYIVGWGQWSRLALRVEVVVLESVSL